MATAKKLVKVNIHYVPVLKTKAGERWALSHLKAETRTRIRPLMELHTHKTKEVGDHVADVCESLAADWGTDRHFYFDGIWVYGDAGDPSVLETMLSLADEHDLKVIPVVRTTFDEASLAAVAGYVESSGRGYMLRIAPRTGADEIATVVDALGLGRDKVDLMLDYKGRGMSLQRDLPSVPNINDWRKLIAASGTFPSSLATLPLREWHPVPRTCWTTYESGIAAPLPRTPIFADYTMRSHGAPADFGVPSVNLRYTLDEEWTVCVGGKVSTGASPEMHEIAAELVASGTFAGPGFSDGDAEIDRVANDDEHPGNSTQWLQWCVNHHIEHVVQQIADA